LKVSLQKIKFPVVEKRRVVFPDKAVCPWCRKRKVYEPHSMAILNAGAMRQVGRDRYEMATDTRAFMTLMWHGAHSGGKGDISEVYASVDVADEVANGQFDLYFCSTACLRRFLNYCVDALEERMEAARLKRKRTSRSARGRTRAQKSA
jgi:hypothetical protein